MKNFFFPTLQNQLKPYSLRFVTLSAVVCLTLLIEVLFYMYVNMAVYSSLTVSSEASTSVAVISTSTDNLTVAQSKVNAGLQETLASTRIIAENVLLALLIYVLIVLIVPMIVIYASHCSASTKLRIKEIYMLFHESIHMATRVIIVIILMYLCNYVLFNPLAGPIGGNLKFIN